MTAHDVALVGTGANPEESSVTEGFSMAYRHADAYAALSNCEIVACADIVRENAAAFAEEYGLPGESVFEDHREMLAAVDPDVVSVCVPPAAHADIVVDCARSGSVEAVHCEKPMDLTWGGARQMAQECWRRGVQLTFNHQRRYGKPVRTAKELLDAGEIGSLERTEFGASNIYDWGTHSIDLCTYFAGEASAEWVLASVDYREEDLRFGAHNENQAVLEWEYDNGVQGFGSTGARRLVDAGIRLVGDEGTIEIDPDDDAVLRVRRAGDAEWERVDCDGETFHGPNFIRRAIADVIECLDEGREPELGARNALTATEIIFGAWESARRRGRVDFPLEVDDNPLEAMVASGDLTPE